MKDDQITSLNSQLASYKRKATWRYMQYKHAIQCRTLIFLNHPEVDRLKEHHEDDSWLLKKNIQVLHVLMIFNSVLWNTACHFNSKLIIFFRIQCCFPCKYACFCILNMSLSLLHVLHVLHVFVALTTCNLMFMFFSTSGEEAVAIEVSQEVQSRVCNCLGE